MELIAFNNSSQRTKNRLKEHGPTFTPKLFNPEPCVALQTLAWFVTSEKTGWEGWIPADEVAAVFS